MPYDAAGNGTSFSPVLQAALVDSVPDGNRDACPNLPLEHLEKRGIGTAATAKSGA